MPTSPTAACSATSLPDMPQEMRFGSYGAMNQFNNTIWRNESDGRLRYGDRDGAVHLITQVQLHLSVSLEYSTSQRSPGVCISYQLTLVNFSRSSTVLLR